jgi:hypothetical protein
MSEYFVKKPCKHCPFRNDVRPYLHPDRAAEIAYAALNPYSSFSCHKTLGEDEEGDTMVIEESRECAGFLTMRAQAGEDIPDGFEPSWYLCYIDPGEMIDAYEEEWNKK